MTSPESPPKIPEDSALLAAWRAGDQRAGRSLFARFYPPLSRFFANKAHDAACADLIQQTFVACLHGLPNLREDGSFRAYLFGIAYRQLCRHYRDKRGDRIEEAEVSVAALDPSVSAIMAARDEMKLFLAGLRELPLSLQVALELHYWENCSVAEIAAALEIPEGTVKSRLRRGREGLRAAIERLASGPQLRQSAIQGMDTWTAGIRALLAKAPKSGAPGEFRDRLSVDPEERHRARLASPMAAAVERSDIALDATLERREKQIGKK